MLALPPELARDGRDRVSGITCPTCHGSLRVRAPGGSHLEFTCRVGHAFSLREVLVALEQFIEDTIWAGVQDTEPITFVVASLDERRGQGP